MGIRFEAAPSSRPEGLFPSLFDFYREHREFYTILYSRGMFSIIMETIIDTIRITPDMPNLEAYMKSFWHMGYMDGCRSGSRGERRKAERR